ncbi:MAG: transporter substrate-binding domain-containing protein [Prevotella sp.]|nr:transporter substrate-binding domain-containing protein [Prevotella sp.]
MQHFARVYINKVEKRGGSLLLLFLLLWLSPSAQAQLAGKYTNSKPLVIVGDWELPPYEFTNNYGQPTGYHVDLLHTILGQMHIPHEFVLKEWSQATEMFEKGDAGLILDPMFRYHSLPYYTSHTILNYYKIKVASRRDARPIQSFDQLKKAQGVVLKSNDMVAHKVIQSVAPDIPVGFHSPKEALSGLTSGKYRYFIWGEEPLKWKIKELALTDEIILHEIDIPAGEIHFTGYDKELIDEIDDQFARLDQSGALEKIRDKWFFPERVHNDTSPVAIYITLGVLLLVIAVYAVNRIVSRRVKVVTRKNSDLENMMTQALSMGKYSVTVYDVQTDRFSNTHGEMLPQEGLSLQQFISRIHPDEQESIAQEIARLKEGKIGIWEMNARWNAGTAGMPRWQYIHGNAIAERDDDGRTKYIVYTIKDVTKEFEQERRDSELASKYFRIFDTTLVAMSFYGKDGWLIDLNENMRKLCGFDKAGEDLFRKTPMFDFPPFKDDFDPKSKDFLHACQHMYYPEAGLDKYLEFRILPVFDGEELQYYVVTARDVTAERQMYMEQYKHNKDLHQANSLISQYENELNYLLENSDMWVWHSDLAEQRINFSRSLQKHEFSETFQEYVAGLYEEEVPKAMEALGHMQGADVNFNVDLHFRHTPVSKDPQWVAISGIPLHDKDGKVMGHFGVVRDITNLMAAQELLRKETARAEDSGKLKSVFLANMTHEIRTPLNAIVGFSDLLQVIDDPTDRREFIRIIRNNCDMLIRLINDIIEASNMNQGPLAIEASDVDWAVAFSDICQTLAQRVQEPGVEFIVDNPCASFLTCVDKGRLQQVITNFTTNAVKYTHQGHIKVGWRYEDGGIYMYCEDTGAGIPKDKQSSVFERFVKLNDYVQGTGLGLSICKSIADRCGGRIGVSSEGEGHGSTFWIWIPCEHKN